MSLLPPGTIYTSLFLPFYKRPPSAQTQSWLELMEGRKVQLQQVRVAQSSQRDSESINFAFRAFSAKIPRTWGTNPSISSV